MTTATSDEDLNRPNMKARVKKDAMLIIQRSRPLNQWTITKPEIRAAIPPEITGSGTSQVRFLRLIPRACRK